MSDRYFRIHNGTNKSSWMVTEDKLSNFEGRESYFISTGFYTKEQYETFQKTKSVAGFDTKTNLVWFDFDSQENIELAKLDAIILVERLLKYFAETNLQISYTGNRGYHILLKMKEEYTSDQVKKVVQKVGYGLKTLDLKIYDKQRILRALNTKHEETSLFKIPLSFNELKSLSIAETKVMAKTVRKLKSEWNSVSLPKELLIVEENKKELHVPIIIDTNDPLKIKEIDFSQKPTGFPDYKWSLCLGKFEIGNRNHSFMVIASTCRALKFGRDHTRAMCLVSDKLHCELTGDHPIDESSLEHEILDVVFSDTWKGGQYSYTNDAELKTYCDKYGFKVEKEVSRTVDLGQAFQIYKYFKQNAGKFIVDTGIPSLNQKIKITIGQVVGVVAGPSVGKTSWALQVLNTMNKKGARSLFFSYDMYIALVIQKLMQKHTSLTEDEIDKKIANMTKEEEAELLQILQEEYGNVGICFETGQNVDDITKTLITEREKHGDINLIVIDYNELISSANSDSTEASKEVAQKLRSLANIHNVCIIVLMQPNKISGGPSDEIKSYRSIKGSSMSEQSLDVILGLSRPGFDSQFPEDDKFVVINCLKNRYGKLFRLELLFDGYNSVISEITQEEDKTALQRVKDRKLQRLEDEDGGPVFDRTPFGGFRRNNGPY